ncbi:MAG: hypothetical protein MI739_00605 [Bacteroidales bacterium]|nr:hypothetical protein [Bacteroidales bacterium]
MNRKNEQYLNMFLVTQSYLEEHISVWSSISRLVGYKKDFDELLARIIDISNKSNNNIAITKRKENLQKTLANKAVKLSGAMQAYCSETNRIDLKKEISITKTKVLRAKDSELKPMISLLIDCSKKYLANLSDFGVTDAMIADLQITLDDFNALIGKPRVILNNKYMQLSILDELFGKANNLLKDKIDKIMVMFKDSENGFYEGYLRNRVIVNK